MEGAVDSLWLVLHFYLLLYLPEADKAGTRGFWHRRTQSSGNAPGSKMVPHCHLRSGPGDLSVRHGKLELGASPRGHAGRVLHYFHVAGFPVLPEGQLPCLRDYDGAEYAQQGDGPAG